MRFSIIPDSDRPRSRARYPTVFPGVWWTWRFWVSQALAILVLCSVSPSAPMAAPRVNGSSIPAARPDRPKYYLPFGGSLVAADAARRWGYPVPPYEAVRKSSSRRAQFRAHLVGDGVKLGFEPGDDIRADVFEEGGLEAAFDQYRSVGDLQQGIYRQDASGVRLITILGCCDGTEGLVLSRVSRHPARRVRLRLGRLQVTGGIGLGTTADDLKNRYGTPTLQTRGKRSQIWWYFGVPGPPFKEKKPNTTDGRPGVEIPALGFTLRQGRVVEILLTITSNSKHGG